MTELQISERYVIEGNLGSGTGGVVYLGKDSITGEKVAIKHFRKTAGSKPALHEASAILGINHPNIVRCLDFCYLGAGDLYLIYEYISGGTLRDLLEKSKALDIETALCCARQIFLALAHIHKIGLIHCDLKPDNIFVQEQDGEIIYKLGDLGVAHFLKQITKEQTVAGSPAYTAPERNYHTFEFNSDLYSMGVIIYEVILGKRPFLGNPSEVMRAHLRQTPDLSEINELRLKDFLGSLLDKDPKYRLRRSEQAIAIIDSITRKNDNVFFRARENQLTAKPFNLSSASGDGAEQVSEFLLDFPYERLFPLTLSGQPILALDYGTQLEFIDGVEGLSLKIIIPNIGMGIQVFDISKIVYSTKSRICLMDIQNPVEKTLIDNCSRVYGIFYSFDEGNVIWSDAKDAHSTDLYKNKTIHFPCSNWGLGAHLRFNKEGQILYSSGPINPSLNLADADGKLIKQYELEGPIMEMTSGPEEFMFITLSHENYERLVIYNLKQNGEIIKELLPKGVEHYTASGSDIIILFQGGAVLAYKNGLKKVKIPINNNFAKAIHTTFDCSYFFTVSNINSKTKISTYKNLNTTD